MSVDTRTSFRRAPKIKGATRTPISLSSHEVAQANMYAIAEQRSFAFFLRMMYLRGLKDYENELANNKQPG
ncbi:hypothetical protein ACO0LG_01730 [Undibacterium sp. Ji42W]|uniref:hypothetical protein n=1 Tax=Undibacterium sp. Ji42W TaxID=3413039 RepID=UPI003BF0A487